jgi:hypothetical protein
MMQNRTAIQQQTTTIDTFTMSIKKEMTALED